MEASVNATQWTIGWIVAGAVVLAVAALLGTVIALASRIRGRLVAIRDVLLRIREATAPMWEVRETRRLTEDATAAAGDIRPRLER